MFDDLCSVEIPFVVTLVERPFFIFIKLALNLAFVCFRDKYDKAEKFLIHKLSTEVESTYNSVQKSEWLKRGARFIHSFVFNIRTFQHSGATTMPFMEWAYLETNMTQLARGELL